MHIRLRGQGECAVEKRLPNGDLQLKRITTNEYTSITEQRFVEALFDGMLEIVSAPEGKTHAEYRSAQKIAAELSLLDERVKQEVKRRFAYVNAVKARGAKLAKEILLPIIAGVSQAMNDPSPPSRATLFRWVRQYFRAGEDLMALTPAYNRRGNRRRKLARGDEQKSDEIARLIGEVIEEKFLSRERPTIANTYDSLVNRIAATNEFRDAGDRLTVPHRNAVYNIVRKLDPYQVRKARYGERLAKEMYDPVKQGARSTRSLERVEIDHTKIDLMVVDPVMRLPVGRPWIITALDHYSRVITGAYISFNPPGYLAVMNCLRHAIAPKGYVRKEYPRIVNTWDAYGVPELIVVDNAPEFHSTDFEDSCLQLGIIVHYAPPKQGKYKGTIERFFGTQNKQLLHNQPGTTFSNIFDRADYDPKANAVVTVDALREMFHLYVVDVYHQQEHRGVRDVPARLWKESIAEYPPALPPDHTALNVLLGSVEARTISARGIELHSLFYNDDALAGLRRRLGKGERAAVKYDSSDLSVIHVADKDNGIYVPVPAVNQDYAQGLSLWQHRIIRDYARRTIMETVDTLALCRAKQKIQEIVEREWLATKRTGTRQRLARYLNHGDEQRVRTRDHVSSQDQLTLVGRTPSRSIPRLGAVSAAAGVSDFGSALDVAEGTAGGVWPPRVEEDDELDMTGWEADYNLPK